MSQSQFFLARLLAPFALAGRPRFSFVLVGLVLGFVLGLAIGGAVSRGEEVAVGLSGWSL